jgi:hypothetical protein
MDQSDDFMVIIKVENHPVDGIVWQWRADGQYFRFDDKLTKEINYKLRDYFLRLMAEEGLLLEREEPQSA